MATAHEVSRDEARKIAQDYIDRAAKQGKHGRYWVELFLDEHPEVHGVGSAVVHYCDWTPHDSFSIEYCPTCGDTRKEGDDAQA